MFIRNHPALKIGDALIISDLHIGLEHEILNSGIRVRQFDDLLERAKKLIKLAKPRRLVINGDLKHNIPFIEKEELRSVPKLLEELSKHVQVIVIPGNHDGSLKQLCPSNIVIAESSGIMIGSTAVLHGHARMAKEMEKAKAVVIGHNHPLLRIEDEVGARFFRKVWIVGKDDRGRKLIIMPAFSNLAGGAMINRIKAGKELMGPEAKKLRLSEAEIFLLDGTCVGRFKDLNKRE